MGDSGAKSVEQCKSTALFLAAKFPRTLEQNAKLECQLDKFTEKDSLNLLPPVPLSGECRKYHHSYEVDSKTTHYYRCFHCTSQTVFEIALLQDMTSRAEVYNGGIQR